jgi:hypothetical protein
MDGKPKEIKKFYSKQFDLIITEANKTFKKAIQLDKSVVAITGVAMVSDREDLMYYRGTIRLEINKDEIFSEGFSVKRIMCLPTMSPNERAYKIGEVLTGNGQINFEYTDKPDGRSIPFAVHTVTLCIDGYTNS